MNMPPNFFPIIPASLFNITGNFNTSSNRVGTFRVYPFSTTRVDVHFAGCILSHRYQYVRAGCVYFFHKQYERGVGVSLSTISSMNMQDMFPIPPPAVWTNGLDMQGVSLSTKNRRNMLLCPFPTPEVWTCWVPLLSTAVSSMDVRGLFFSTASTVDVLVYPFPSHVKC
jgi:hypothetical protein